MCHNSSLGLSVYVCKSQGPGRKSLKAQESNGMASLLYQHEQKVDVYKSPVNSWAFHNSTKLGYFLRKSLKNLCVSPWSEFTSVQKHQVRSADIAELNWRMT